MLLLVSLLNGANKEFSVGRLKRTGSLGYFESPQVGSRQCPGDGGNKDPQKLP